MFIKYAGILIGAYLLGSLSLSILVSGALFGKDIRTEGSGNAGATNMARVFGWGAGLLTLAGDAAKAVICMVVGNKLGGELGLALAGMGCIFGHCYPVFHHFKGGKGVSVGGVIAFGIDWRVGLCVVGAFLIGALLAPDLPEIFTGLGRICTVPAQLTKDYFKPELGSISGSMLNYFLVGAVCCALMFLPGAKVNGGTVLGYFLTLGFCSYGMSIINILPLQPEERISAMIHARDYDEDAYLVFVTRSGTVKRLNQSALKNIRSNGIRALNLDEGDELISVRQTDGSQNILIATHDGYAICFAETDIRPMGRDAVGVRGIRLREGDFVVGAARAREGGMLLSVTENGYGKRTPIEEYIRGDGEPQHRGGKGLKNYNCTEKTGAVADCKVVDEDDDLLIISDDGTIIRMDVAEISVYSRATQGVRLMRVSEGSRVISIARTEKENAETDAAGEAPEAEPEA